MIKPTIGKKFSTLNDSVLRNRVIDTVTNTIQNNSIEDSDYGINTDILDLYLTDDTQVINVNMDWDDEFECQQSVISDGMNLKYVKLQTPEICMAAVTNNGWALQYVRKQTKEMCKVAVSNNGMALEFVKHQTEEICKLAVQNNPLSFRFVKDPSDEFTMFAIFEDTRNIRFARNVTPKMCKLLVDIDPHIIFQLNNPPPELCLYVIRKDLQCIGSVRFNEVPTGTILNELQAHLVMAQLKYGDIIKYDPDISVWYLPGLIHSYKV